jgi:hypothetical protein
MRYTPSRSLRVILLFLLLFTWRLAESQMCIGLGYGTNNFHVQDRPFGTYAPRITISYIPGSMNGSLFFNTSVYTSRYDQNDYYSNSQDQQVLYQHTATDRHLIMELGFKRFFNGDIDRKKIIVFGGGGLAECITWSQRSTKGADPQYVDAVDNKFQTSSFGIQARGGIQYYLRPVVIELSVYACIYTQPIIESPGEANIYSGNSLTIHIPLHHFE